MNKNKHSQFNTKRMLRRISAVLMGVIIASSMMPSLPAYAASGKTKTDTDTEETVSTPIREAHRVKVGNNKYCFFVQHNVVLTPSQVRKLSDNELVEEIVKQSGLFMKETNCRKVSHKVITYKSWIRQDHSFGLSEADLERIRGASPSDGTPVKLHMDLRVSLDPAPEEEKETDKSKDDKTKDKNKDNKAKEDKSKEDNTSDNKKTDDKSSEDSTKEDNTGDDSKTDDNTSDDQDKTQQDNTGEADNSDDKSGESAGDSDNVTGEDSESGDNTGEAADTDADDNGSDDKQSDSEDNQGGNGDADNTDTGKTDDGNTNSGAGDQQGDTDSGAGDQSGDTDADKDSKTGDDDKYTQKDERKFYSTSKLLSPELLFVVVATKSDAAKGEDICTLKTTDEEPSDDIDEPDTDGEKDEMLPEYRTIQMADRSGKPLEPTLQDGTPVTLKWVEPKKTINTDDMPSFLQHIPGGLAGLIGILAAIAAAAAVIIIRRRAAADEYEYEDEDDEE